MRVFSAWMMHMTTAVRLRVAHDQRAATRPRLVLPGTTPSYVFGVIIYLDFVEKVSEIEPTQGLGVK